MTHQGETIKTEAWVLRRLVTIFSQVARRPHVPRDAQMRRLFSVVGIEASPTAEPTGLTALTFG